MADHRYDIPDVFEVDAALGATTADAVARAVRAALRQAVMTHRAKAGAQSGAAEETLRAPKVVPPPGAGMAGPATFEPMVFGPAAVVKARVVDAPAPFDGATVLRFDATKYVAVQSKRHAVASNPHDAAHLGDVLFSTTGFALAVRIREKAEVYYAAGLSRPVKQSDFRGLKKAPSGAGVAYLFDPAVVEFFDRLEGGFLVRAVFLEGGRAFVAGTLRATRALQTELDDLEAAQAPGEASAVPAEVIRAAVFAPIEALLTAGRTEAAAAHLAALDEDAFAYVTLAEKIRYLRVLVEAFTFEKQERAAVALIRSLASRAELVAVRDALAETGLRKKLMRDLDAQAWPFLREVGRRFAEPLVLTPEALVALARELGLVPASTRAMLERAARVMAPNMLVVDPDALAEFRALASGAWRFGESMARDVAAILNDPAAFFEGLAKLAELLYVVGLAATGHPAAREKVAQLAALAGRAASDTLQGARLFGVAESMLRRIKYALVVEVASALAGTGSVRAAGMARRAVRLASSLTGASLRAGGLGRTAAQVVAAARTLERLGDFPSGTGEVLRLMEHLPARDQAAARRLIEAFEARDAVRPRRALSPEAQADAQALAARLGQLVEIQRALGQLTPEATVGLGKMVTAGLSDAEIAGVVRLLGDDRLGAHRFFDVIRKFSDADLTGVASRGARTFEALARHAALRNFADAFADADGLAGFLTLDRIAKNDTLRLRRYVETFYDATPGQSRADRLAFLKALEAQRSRKHTGAKPETDALNAAFDAVVARSGGDMDDAAIRRLATVAARPGVQTEADLITALQSDLALIRLLDDSGASGGALRTLSREAFRRVFNKMPTLHHVAGQLAEEIAAARRRAALLASDQTLIEGHRILDEAGLQVTDGLVVRGGWPPEAGKPLVVDEIIEVKAGPEAAKGLYRSDSSRKKLKQDEKNERLRLALDLYYEGNEAARRRDYAQARQEVLSEMPPADPGLGPEALAARAEEIRRRTYARWVEHVRRAHTGAPGQPSRLDQLAHDLPLAGAGQVRRDLERLMPGTDGALPQVKIDGTFYEVIVSTRETVFRAATPSDVDVRERVPLPGVQALDLGLPAKDLRAVARRLYAEYTVLKGGP